jgi:outer membrane protein TolC
VERAEAALDRLLGVRGGSSFRVEPRLPELPPADPATAELVELALAQRLDLLASQAAVEASAETVPLARWQRLESIDVGVHFEREPDGTHTTGPEVEVAIPIFDRGQAAEAQALYMREQAEARREALVLDIEAEVRAAATRLRAARKRAVYHRQVILPRRERLAAEGLRFYNYMLAGTYQVLEAKEGELAAGRAAIAAELDYWRAHAELMQAVGGTLGSLAARPAAAAFIGPPALPGRPTEAPLP